MWRKIKMYDSELQACADWTDGLSISSFDAGAGAGELFVMETGRGGSQKRRQGGQRRGEMK